MTGGGGPLGAGGAPGSGAGGQASGVGAAATVQFAPAERSFKRLTDSEFRNSLRDLLGEVTIGDLEPDTWLDPHEARQAGRAPRAPDLRGLPPADGPARTHA